MASLTGRTRYRRTWLGKLVLQIEVDLTGSAWFSQMDMRTHTTWRDAKVSDFDTSPPGMFSQPPMPYPGQKPVSGYRPIGTLNPKASPPAGR